MMPDTAPELATGCACVEWDSEFFGRRIARVDPARFQADPEAVDAWCAERCIDCVYLLVDVAESGATATAQAHGFRLVDVRVTLEADLASGQTEVVSAVGAVVRSATPEDIEALRAVARVSHRFTRFYVDGHFDRTRCDDLYELWITKSCGGWSDRVLVVEAEGRAAAYVTCHLRDRTGAIGLFAVAPEFRGLGFGGVLLERARQWFVEQEKTRMTVVTQARNASALRLYQRAGMDVTAIELWFHKWRKA
jgi:dTDP-4-amino-4,6-dideoxy-D-galactose acyltransferase